MRNLCIIWLLGACVCIWIGTRRVLARPVMPLVSNSNAVSQLEGSIGLETDDIDDEPLPLTPPSTAVHSTALSAAPSVPGAVVKVTDKSTNIYTRRGLTSTTGMGDVLGDPLLLVATADGSLHALSEDFSLIWSTRTGGPLASSQMAAESSHDETPRNRETSSSVVLTTLDGQLLLRDRTGRLSRVGESSAESLVRETPFVSGDGRLFAGSEKNRWFAIDLRTGRVLSPLSSCKPLDEDGVDECTDEDLQGGNTWEEEDTEGGGTAGNVEEEDVEEIIPFWLSRVDFRLTATDGLTGRKEFSVTHSRVQPIASRLSGNEGRQSHGNPRSGDFHEEEATEAADAAILDLRLIGTPRGALYALSDQGTVSDSTKPIGTTQLGAPAVSAFLALRDKSGRVLRVFTIPLEHRADWVMDKRVAADDTVIETDDTVLERPDVSGYISPSRPSTEIVVLDMTSRAVIVRLPNSRNLVGAEFVLPFVDSPLLSGNSDDMSSTQTAFSPSDSIVSHYLPLPSPRDILETDRHELSEDLSSWADSTVVPQSRLITSSTFLPALRGPLAVVAASKTVINKDTNNIDGDARFMEGFTMSQILEWQRRSLAGDATAQLLLAAAATSAAALGATDREALISVALRPNVGNIADSTALAANDLHPKRVTVTVTSPLEDRSDFFAHSDILNSSPLFRAFTTLSSLVVFLVLLTLFFASVYAFWLHTRPRNKQPNWFPRRTRFVNQFLAVLRQWWWYLSVESSAAAEAAAVAEAGFHRVGQLLVSDVVMGTGSHGTVVFEGRLNGRPVAVKRVLTQFCEVVDREVKMLIRSDGHPNVVRYFLKEEQHGFVYLGLQLCRQNLRDFVMETCRNRRAKRLQQRNGDSGSGGRLVDYYEAATAESEGEILEAGTITDEVRQSLLQITLGLDYLHRRKIVHRDIKPHNILCASPEVNTDTLPAASDKNTANSHGKSKSKKHPRSEPVSVSVESSRIENSDSLSGLAQYVLKISDMGLSKQLDLHDTSSSLARSFHRLARPPGEESLALSSYGAAGTPRDIVGTIGWQAPELILGYSQNLYRDRISLNNAPGKDDQPHVISQTVSQTPTSECKVPTAQASEAATSLAIDIFSLGCVFFFVLTLGKHPFGAWYEREANIVRGEPALLAVDSAPDARHLLAMMLASSPDQRPTSGQVAAHPFFWSSSRRLDFLLELSDRLESLSPTTPLLLALEAGVPLVVPTVGHRWDTLVDDNLLAPPTVNPTTSSSGTSVTSTNTTARSYRRYDCQSLRDLLRVIRNRRHHFNELPADLRASLSPMPTAFLEYFERRFPRLTLHCVAVASRFLSDEPAFEGFLRDLPPMGSIASLTQPPREATILTDARERTCAKMISNVAVGVDNEETYSPSPITVPSSPQFGATSYSTSSDLVVPNVSDKSGMTSVAVPDESPIDNSVDDDVLESTVHTKLTNIEAAQAAEAEADLASIVIWRGSAMESAVGCRGWYRPADSWTTTAKPGRITTAQQRAVADPKYRVRLCAHFDASGGMSCPMKRKGRCTFAHGPLELRVKDPKKPWPVRKSSTTPEDELRVVGGEDFLTKAREYEARVAASPAPSNPSVNDLPSLPLNYTGVSTPSVPPPPSLFVPSMAPPIKYVGESRKLNADAPSFVLS